MMEKHNVTCEECASVVTDKLPCSERLTIWGIILPSQFLSKLSIQASAEALQTLSLQSWAIHYGSRKHNQVVNC